MAERIAAAQAIAHRLYGIEAEVKQLDGFIDLNFLLRVGTRKYVLKLTADHSSAAYLHTQNQALQLLHPHFPEAIPEIVTNVNGKLMEPTQLNGQQYLVRLLSFMEGTFLAKVPHTTELLYNYGVFIGKVDALLAQEHLPISGKSDKTWDLQHFLECHPFLHHINDPHQRRVVDYFFLQYQEQVLPVLGKLRKSTIHGDANDWNTLVAGNAIVGLIDFGDLSYTPTINELAIGIAYAVMSTTDPLHAATAAVKGYHSVYPLEEQELQILYYLVAARLCTTLTMTAYSRSLDPDNTYISISAKPAWELLQQWIAINPQQAHNTFRVACNYAPLPIKDVAAMVEQRHQHLSKALSISYATPIHMQQAALQYMYDVEGNTYLDGVNNICHVGHCHPKVVRAGQQQMALLNTNTRYLYDALNDYAAQLCATFPEPLNKVFFVNSGSAATDLALRLARSHTGKHEMIIVDHSYHGNTNAAIEISAYKFDGKGGKGKANHIHQAPIPDTYRGAYKATDPEAGKKYAAEVAAMYTDQHQIAGFICESIVGCGGQVMLPPSYLKEVYQTVHAHGGVCIADEVQTGFGRVGHHFWGFELYDVVPDMVILGKPMGNGHPIAAVVTTEAIAASFENGMEFFSSFGGNPVSCTIGKAVLDVIQEEGLQQHALEVGNYLLASLRNLKTQFPIIGDVRGAGLFLGIELVEDPTTLTPATEAAKNIIHHLKMQGIFLSTDGPYNNVLKFKPPLCFSMHNAQQLIKALTNSLAQLQ